jgi:hypothetical protein
VSEQEAPVPPSPVEGAPGAYATICAAFTAGFLEGEAFRGDADYDYAESNGRAKRLAQSYWIAMRVSGNASATILADGPTEP